jgi:hypothetical protein
LNDDVLNNQSWTVAILHFITGKQDNVDVNRDAAKSLNLSGADDKIAKQSSAERSAKVARFAASVQRIVIVQSRTVQNTWMPLCESLHNF